MPTEKNRDASQTFNLAFRPDTYWPKKKAVGRDANELLRSVIAAEKTGNWSKVKFPSTAFGAAGGSFLPSFRRMEREVARISLQSATSDVISIRVAPSARGIRYRIVDEYESDQTLPRTYSKRPLTMREIVKLINGINGGDGSPDALRNYAMSSETVEEVEEVRSFVSVWSAYYPQLERWFDREADKWAIAKLAMLSGKKVSTSGE